MEKLSLDVVASVKPAFVATLVVQTLTQDKVREAQERDQKYVKLKKRASNGEAPNFWITMDGLLRYEHWVRVPDNDDLKREILEKAHQTPYTIHLGSINMYWDMKECYWWSNMKMEILKYVQCSTF